VAARYERLRPWAAGLAAPRCVEQQLLQSCGLALWARTCCATAPRPPAAVPPRGGDQVPSATAVPAQVRPALVAILAGLVRHHCYGGSHDERAGTLSAAGRDHGPA
jgi:hypothetical protein